MPPNGNVIVDTICRTAEHGDSYHHRSRARRAHQRIPHVRAARQDNEQAPQRHPRLLRHKINAL
ncbi:hypothetical protein B1A61_08325 [Corynebacterium diphtheriae]|nr:hypothetical protein B1A65_11160 [Corynebacterium diphtheriae]OSQ04956.1 hypothetical protein B1A61_08325 [Corynebacterium diphtheriae]